MHNSGMRSVCAAAETGRAIVSVLLGYALSVVAIALGIVVFIDQVNVHNELKGLLNLFIIIGGAASLGNLLIGYLLYRSGRASIAISFLVSPGMVSSVVLWGFNPADLTFFVCLLAVSIAAYLGGFGIRHVLIQMTPHRR